MKKLFFIAAIIIGCLSFKMANAQQAVFHIGVNVGNQPEWGPVGYHHARYYYMPDVDAYYDVNAHQYVYNENNVWVHGGALPPRYGNFDRYHSYKAVINQRNPWERHEEIRTRYAGFKGHNDQRMIRDSRDYHYRNHWKEDGQGNQGHGHDGGDKH